jgi:DNA primase large subunit
LLFPEVLQSLAKTYKNYELIDKDILEVHKTDLLDTYNCTFKKDQNMTEDKIKETNFYKVNFTDALDLVKTRKVFIKKGICFVPAGDLQHLLTFQFKSLLTQNVALTAKILPNLDEDDRLIKMLSELDKRYTGDDYAASNTDVLRPEQIKPLNAKGAFPMCMRSMQNSLEKTHHLKYKARLQYGLFLKGIGLSLDDALRFFRGEFTQSHVDADKFDKEYTYGIRYKQCFFKMFFLVLIVR